MKLQQNVNGQFTVTIPKAFVRLKGWSKGELLTVRVDDKGRLVIS